MRPGSVDPGSPLTGVDLFTLTIGRSAAAGNNGLILYDLIGGTDPNCAFDQCMGSTGTFNFSVTVNSPVITPEPGSFALLVSALVAGLFVMRRAGH